MKAAKVENGVITQVIMGDVNWANSRLDGEWVDVTEVTAGRGWTWHGDHARPPQPYPSWTWDGEGWQAPVPRPDGDELDYLWDELLGQWVEDVPDEHYDPNIGAL